MISWELGDISVKDSESLRNYLSCKIHARTAKVHYYWLPLIATLNRSWDHAAVSGACSASAFNRSRWVAGVVSSSWLQSARGLATYLHLRDLQPLGCLQSLSPRSQQASSIAHGCVFLQQEASDISYLRYYRRTITTSISLMQHTKSLKRTAIQSGDCNDRKQHFRGEKRKIFGSIIGQKYEDSLLIVIIPCPGL